MERKYQHWIRIVLGKMSTASQPHRINNNGNAQP